MSQEQNRTLLVTGASGQLGRRVVELLLEKKAGQVVAVTRTPEKLNDLAQRGAIIRAGSFDEPGPLEKALAGADRMLLISTSTIDPGGSRLKQHVNAVNAAARAGVKHVVYTSMPHPDPDSPIFFAPDHRGTEEALAKSGLSWTIHRDNWYTESLVGMGTLPRAVASGKLYAAAGDGGAAYVTREDCARAAAASVASESTANKTLNITGPAVVTYAELAKMASELSGRPVTYVAMEPEAMKAALIGQGVPEIFAKLTIGSDLAKARGKMGPASNNVLELTGRAPTSVASYLAAHKDALLGRGAKAAG
jgi:NAD(P)H dehydrogenase (quinone)